MENSGGVRYLPRGVHGDGVVTLPRWEVNPKWANQTGCRGGVLASTSLVDRPGTRGRCSFASPSGCSLSLVYSSTRLIHTRLRMPPSFSPCVSICCSHGGFFSWGSAPSWQRAGLPRNLAQERQAQKHRLVAACMVAFCT
jgi:hypothetical protein